MKPKKKGKAFRKVVPADTDDGANIVPACLQVATGDVLQGPGKVATINVIGAPSCNVSGDHAGGLEPDSGSALPISLPILSSAAAVTAMPTTTTQASNIALIVNKSRGIAVAVGNRSKSCLKKIFDLLCRLFGRLLKKTGAALEGILTLMDSLINNPNQYFKEVVPRLQIAGGHGPWQSFRSPQSTALSSSTDHANATATSLLLLQLTIAFPAALLMLSSQWFVLKHNDTSDPDYGNVGKALQSLVFPLASGVSLVPQVFQAVQFDWHQIASDRGIIKWWLLRFELPLGLLITIMIYSRAFESIFGLIGCFVISALLLWPVLEMARRLLGYEDWQDPRKILSGNMVALRRTVLGFQVLLTSASVLMVWLAFDLMWLSKQQGFWYQVLRVALLNCVKKIVSLGGIFPYQAGGYHVPVARHYVPLNIAFSLGILQALYFCSIRGTTGLVIAFISDWSTFLFRVWVLSDTLEDFEIRICGFRFHIFAFLRLAHMWGRLKPVTKLPRVRPPSHSTPARASSTMNAQEEQMSDSELRCWIVFCESFGMTAAYLVLVIYYLLDLGFIRVSEATLGENGAGGLCRKEGSHSTLAGALFFPTDMSIYFLMAAFVNDFVQDKVATWVTQKWAGSTFERHLSGGWRDQIPLVVSAWLGAWTIPVLLSVLMAGCDAGLTLSA